MDGLMQEMPKIELQFENAKNSALKQIAQHELKELIFSLIILI
jgi:hypothetical protein